MLMDSNITVRVKAIYYSGGDQYANLIIYKGSSKSSPKEFPGMYFMGSEVDGYSNYSGNYLIDY